MAKLLKRQPLSSKARTAAGKYQDAIRDDLSCLRLLPRPPTRGEEEPASTDEQLDRRPEALSRRAHALRRSRLLAEAQSVPWLKLKHGLFAYASETSIEPLEALLHNRMMDVDIGDALKRARTAIGLPAKAIADQLGISVQAVYQWEKGATKPDMSRLVRAAEVLGADAAALLRGEYVPAAERPSEPTERPTAKPLEPSSVERDETAPSARRQAGRLRDVPEVGIVVGGSDGDFEMNGTVIAYTPRPPALVGRDVFAVRVKNDSMEPRYEEGDLLYVERHREPAVGDDAVVELLGPDEHVAGPAFIKRLVRKTSREVVVKQLNPPLELVYDRSRIKRLYRVMKRNEVFGV